MSLLLVLTHKSALNLNLGMCETLSGGPSTIEAYQEPPFNVMRNNFHGKVLGFLIWWDQTSWLGTVVFTFVN